jgi:hypothetical protein
LKAKDLIKILTQHPEETVEVLSTRSHPLRIETVYFDKEDKRYIIETN